MDLYEIERKLLRLFHNLLRGGSGPESRSASWRLYKMIQITRNNFNKLIDKFDKLLLKIILTSRYLHRLVLDRYKVQYKLTPTGKPCFVPSSDKIGLIPMKKRFIISIPKSGTYFMVALLERLGLQSTGIHLSTHDIEDHRGEDSLDLRINPSKYQIKIPIEYTFPLILQGQFSWGHIPCEPYTIHSMADTKKIFLYRELRDVIISNIRHQVEIRQDVKKGFIFDKKGSFDEANIYFRSPITKQHFKIWFHYFGRQNILLTRNIQKWQDQKDVLSVAFEDVIGKNGDVRKQKVLKEIIKHLEISECDTTSNLDGIIGDTSKIKTHTKTDRSSEHSEYWDDEIEEMFELYGFKKMNEQMGYK